MADASKPRCQQEDPTDEVSAVPGLYDGHVYYVHVRCAAAADWHGVSADGEMLICERHRVEGDPNPLSSDPFWWVPMGNAAELARAREANADYLTPDQFIDEVAADA
jgi:hypothetical protein